MDEMNNQVEAQKENVETEVISQEELLVDSTDSPSNDNSDMPVDNEQTAKKEKKHINKKIVLAIIIPSMLIIIALVVFLTIRGTLSSKADTVIALINESSIDEVKISEAYDSMDDMGKKFFSSKVKNSFIRMVENNKYSSASSAYLVNDDIINDYKQYKKVCEALDITSEYSNVVEYIDKVVSLSAYSEYNNVYNMYYNTYSLVMNANDTVQSALKNNRGTLSKERLFGDAYDMMDEAYNKALKIWDGSKKGEDYIDALWDIEGFYQYVSYNFNNYYTSTLLSKDCDDGVDVFNGFVDTFKEAMEKISNVEKSLPKIEIYG